MYQFLACHTTSSELHQANFLETSLARSHAAKVAHARTRARLLPTNTPGDENGNSQKGARKGHSDRAGAGVKGRFRLRKTNAAQPGEAAVSTSVETSPTPTETDEEEHAPHDPHAVDPAASERYLNTSFLDPFFPITGALSFQEKNLLHSYFVSIPAKLYGTNSSSAYCPVREITVRSVGDNPIWLSWVLLQEEVRNARRHVMEPERETSTLSRRHKTYQLMNGTLAARDTALLDETIVGVAAAGVIEWRLGNPYEAQKHLKASLTLLSLRGGLRAIQDLHYPSALVTLLVFIEIGCTAHYEILGTLYTAISTATRRLGDFQKWNQTIRTLDSASRHPICKESLQSSHQTYRSCFSEPSALRANIESEHRHGKPSEMRPYLGVLYCLNSILWHLRATPDKAAAFLEDLSYTVSMSVPVQSPVSGTATQNPLLSSMSILFMIAHCAEKLGEWTSSEHSALRIWEVIDFVDLVVLAPPELRDKVIKALASWLTEPLSGSGDSLELLTEGDLTAFVEGVEQGWVSELGLG